MATARGNGSHSRAGCRAYLPWGACGREGLSVLPATLQCDVLHGAVHPGPVRFFMFAFGVLACRTIRENIDRKRLEKAGKLPPTPPPKPATQPEPNPALLVGLAVLVPLGIWLVTKAGQ